MSQMNSIPKTDWVEYLDMLTNGNRGRMIKLDLVGEKIGDLKLVSGSPLLGIDYDPADKGNDILISLGKEEIEMSHKVVDPVSLFTLNDNHGKITNLEILDGSQIKTIISFV